MADEESEKFNYSDLAPWTTKYDYVTVFGVPDEPWRIGALWEEAYFDSAKYVIEGVLKGYLSPHVHGVAGVFLFRHYLEIALKFIVFHARWLVDAEQNARREDIQDVGNTHNLKWPWERVEEERRGKIPDDTWTSWDIEFAKKMLLEFHAIDTSGFRFRYHGDKFGVEKAPAEASVTNELDIRYDVLLSEMEHTRGVLFSDRQLLVRKPRAECRVGSGDEFLVMRHAVAPYCCQPVVGLASKVGEDFGALAVLHTER